MLTNWRRREPQVLLLLLLSLSFFSSVCFCAHRQRKKSRLNAAAVPKCVWDVFLVTPLFSVRYFFWWLMSRSVTRRHPSLAPEVPANEEQFSLCRALWDLQPALFKKQDCLLSCVHKMNALFFASESSTGLQTPFAPNMLFWAALSF